MVIIVKVIFFLVLEIWMRKYVGDGKREKRDF